jgi:BASS family bile acid:Na+ symporter
MTLQTLILFILKASVALSVFAIGLQSRPEAIVAVLRRPGLLLRSIFVMDILMPALGVAIVLLLNLPQTIEVALVAIAISPVPPLLPKKQLKAHGEPSYTVGLMIAAALVAVVFIPIAVDLLGRVFQTPAQMRPWPVARLVLETIFTPLAAGVLVSKFAETFAAKVAKPVFVGSMTLLIVSFAPILYAAAPAMFALMESQTILAIAAFVFLGLATGHAFGGPDPRNRTVLALATAIRHPGVALAIAATNFPSKETMQPAILLYTLLSGLLTVPYVIWRKRRS